MAIVPNAAAKAQGAKRSTTPAHGPATSKAKVAAPRGREREKALRLSWQIATRPKRHKKQRLPRQ
eukprot:12667055-Prorocentrum_lima.AAC.1